MKKIVMIQKEAVVMGVIAIMVAHVEFHKKHFTDIHEQ